MIPLIVIGIILLFFAALLSLKATIKIIYDGEVRLTVRVLFLNIGILPKKEEKKKSWSMSAKKARKISDKLEKKRRKKALKKKQKAEAKQQKKEAEKNVKKEKKSPAEILDIISLVTSLVKQVVGKFFGHLRIKLARLHLVIGTGDAAMTAIAYGALTQSINVLFPLLEDVKNFSLPKVGDIDIRPDFTSEESEIDICILFSLRVWHLFHVAFAALGEVIKYFFKSMKTKAEKQERK